ILVVKKHISPHRWIGGRYPSEVAKAPSGKFDDLGPRDLLEVGGGADNVICDQMRHMARDREHQVMVAGAHDLDVRTKRLPKGAHLPSAAGSAPSGGVKIHQRLTK